MAAYVDKIVVREDHIDLFLKVVLDFHGGGGPIIVWLGRPLIDLGTDVRIDSFQPFDIAVVPGVEGIERLAESQGGLRDQYIKRAHVARKV